MKSTTKERPIIFGPESIRAILAGRKNQTRRVVEPRVFQFEGHWSYFRRGICTPFWTKQVEGSDKIETVYPTEQELVEKFLRCPYGQAGSSLWVRETWAPSIMDPECEMDPATGDNCTAEYRATDDGREWMHDEVDRATGKLTSTPCKAPWRSPIHMPRWASRLMLEIESVRVERLQDISHSDIRAEGLSCPEHDFPGGFCTSECPALRRAWAEAWDGINGKRAPWSSSPWVWVLAFRRAEASR